MATWDEYVKAMQAKLQSIPLEMTPPTEEEKMVEAALLEESGLADEELNEVIELLCKDCGATRTTRYGEWYGELPWEPCAEPGCSGMMVEDRKGKPTRPKAEDNKCLN